MSARLIESGTGFVVMTEVGVTTTCSLACVFTLCFSRSRSTGKERDAESGNDYFNARYYASTMGRFISSDYNDENDEIKPVPYANLEDPQGLNQYAYGGNNPLTNVDPDGHACQTTTGTREFNGQVIQTWSLTSCSGLTEMEHNLYDAFAHKYNPLQVLANYSDNHPWTRTIARGIGGECPPGKECIQSGVLPWGMTGELLGASKLFTTAEENALGGVLKQIA